MGERFYRVRRDHYDRNIFNRTFDHINGTQETRELQVYEKPKALVSGEQPFVEIDKNGNIKDSGTQFDNFFSLNNIAKNKNITKQLPDFSRYPRNKANERFCPRSILPTDCSAKLPSLNFLKEIN